MGEKRKDTRKRIMHKFWLDRTKPEEKHLHGELEVLKEKRQFQPKVREGLSLVMALEQGNIDLLLDRYPFIIEAIIKRYAPSPDNDRLARLESLLLQMQSSDSGVLMKSTNSDGPKQLNVPKAPAPNFDDDEDLDLLKVKKAKPSGNSGYNFLKSAFALQGIDYDDVRK
jgi:hypothetical protein